MYITNLFVRENLSVEIYVLISIFMLLYRAVINRVIFS